MFIQEAEVQKWQVSSSASMELFLNIVTAFEARLIFEAG